MKNGPGGNSRTVFYGRGKLMAEFFASGLIIDLILGLVVIEVIALAFWRRRFGIGPTLGGLAANLASGGFLLLAVRAALVDASWEWIAFALLGSLAAHLADLYGRWQG
jgi:F0F1-type ATP synthase assembly protein I